MPLIVKDFQWRQTKALVTIQVPLHGVHQSKVDLFTSPKYIKASYELYFFEAFLLRDIKAPESKCTITPTDVVFELVKHEEILWENLEIKLSKTEKMQLKKQAIDEEHQRIQNEHQEKLDKKSRLKKVAVQEAISLDTKQRQLIDHIKSSEKSVALGDLDNWQQQMTQPKIIKLPSDDKEDKKSVKPIKPKAPIIPRRLHTKASAAEPKPLPRKSGVLKLDFTERQFPTPSRESQLEEETEWLTKQAEVRRSIGFDCKDLRPEEKNPQYLKSKGEEFLKAKNYLAAISAFSFGIKLVEEFPDLYIGRSQAHFELGNFFKTTQDCSKALDLLKPAVQSNLNERISCIARRGLALCQLGMPRQGVDELEMAVKLRPSDDDLRAKLEEARNLLNSTETST